MMNLEKTPDPCRVFGGKRWYRKNPPLPWRLQLPSGKLLSKENQNKSRNLRVERKAVTLKDDWGPDLRKFYEIIGERVDWDYYKTSVGHIQAKSKNRYTLFIEGEPIASFTDVQEAMSQARSIEFFGGWEAKVIMS